jgi:HSP20 family protein
MTSLLTRHGVFDDFFRDFAPGIFVRPAGASANVDQAAEPAPIRVDVAETEGGYAVHAELPGVSKDDIQVTLDGDAVTLRAEVKLVEQRREDEQGGVKWLRVERRAGQFARSFRLPAEVDSAKAEAKYDNGVLRLTLPKKLQTNAQRLTIQ